MTFQFRNPALVGDALRSTTIACHCCLIFGRCQTSISDVGCASLAAPTLREPRGAIAQRSVHYAGKRCLRPKHHGEDRAAGHKKREDRSKNSVGEWARRRMIYRKVGFLDILEAKIFARLRIHIGNLVLTHCVGQCIVICDIIFLQ